MEEQNAIKAGNNRCSQSLLDHAWSPLEKVCQLNTRLEGESLVQQSRKRFEENWGFGHLKQIMTQSNFRKGNPGVLKHSGGGEEINRLKIHHIYNLKASVTVNIRR